MKAEDHSVGPVFQTGFVTDAMISAIKDLNKNVLVIDRGSYLRVSVSNECIVTRKLVEEKIGRPIDLKKEIEHNMVSFEGKLSINEDYVKWSYDVKS